MKITFITFHNWNTKRIGGFHKFAEAASLAGHEVVFFSFDRPYFIYFKDEERLNRDVLRDLSKGKTYEIVKGPKTGKLINCTWPTLKIPMPIYKFIPTCINGWLSVHSLKRFSSFQKKFLEGTDVFVFESCEGIFLLDIIKKYNPKAKLIYRPSDPLMVPNANQNIIRQEKKMLYEADLSVIVNKEGLNLYKQNIHNFEKLVKYTILSNGVDLELFKVRYKKPDALCKTNTALYVGARDIEWNLIIKAAVELRDINFIIVCPERPPQSFLKSNLPNLIYIGGIKPVDVPKWVTNCDVVIIPNPKDRYQIKPWGITAKYYQAMAAGKPIVAFDDTDELKKFDVYVSHCYEDFIKDLKSAFAGDKCNYSNLIENKNWTSVTNQFLNLIETI